MEMGGASIFMTGRRYPGPARLRHFAPSEYFHQEMTLPESRPSAPRAAERGRLQRELASLLADIAATRAGLARQADLLKDLHHRLDRDLRPWEGKLAAARRETLRILGRQYREGWLPRRDGERLREALRGLADELESGFGLDLKAERRDFLDQIVMTAAEAAAQAEAERSGRQARLDALRKAIENEDGPREAAARAKRERMDALRKALRGEAGEGTGDAGGSEDGGRDIGASGRRKGEDARGRMGGEGPGSRDEDIGERDGSGPQGPGSRRPGPNPGAKDGGRAKSASARGDAEDEALFAGDLRALYLLLARALHPDKEPDPARREAKTGWMQKVTAAYGARDLARLLDILAQDPLGSVGPYLSAAPLAAVKGFAKRLRRELASLRAKAELGRTGVHPSLRRFLGPQGIIDSEVKRYSAQLKKEVRFVKERNEMYKERTAVEEMLKAMGGDWRGYL
jgi:hypothetical protein